MFSLENSLDGLSKRFVLFGKYSPQIEPEALALDDADHRQGGAAQDGSMTGHLGSSLSSHGRPGGPAPLRRRRGSDFDFEFAYAACAHYDLIVNDHNFQILNFH